MHAGTSAETQCATVGEYGDVSICCTDEDGSVAAQRAAEYTPGEHLLQQLTKFDLFADSQSLVKAHERLA